MNEYLQFQDHCLQCKQIWNAQSGTDPDGVVFVAPIVCPYCDSHNIEKFADAWMTFGRT